MVFGFDVLMVYSVVLDCYIYLWCLDFGWWFVDESCVDFVVSGVCFVDLLLVIGDGFFFWVVECQVVLLICVLLFYL